MHVAAQQDHRKSLRSGQLDDRVDVGGHHGEPLFAADIAGQEGAGLARADEDHVAVFDQARGGLRDPVLFAVEGVLLPPVVRGAFGGGPVPVEPGRAVGLDDQPAAAQRVQVPADGRDRGAGHLLQHGGRRDPVRPEVVQDAFFPFGCIHLYPSFIHD